jgi:hypothetical protein
VVARVLPGCDNHHHGRYHSARDELGRNCDLKRYIDNFAPIQRVTRILFLASASVEALTDPWPLAVGELYATTL